MPIRFQLLRSEDLPMACQLIAEAAEWSPKSQLFDNPMDTLLRPRSQWMSALSGEELLGIIGFHDISLPDSSAEMFTGIVPKWRGKGFAANLVTQQLDFAFKDMGLRRITMTCLEGSPSAKIADKMKVPLEGRFVRSRLKRGVYHDSLAYGLERT